MAKSTKIVPTEYVDRWLRKKEVLHSLGVSPNTLKKLISVGEIHPIILAPNCHRYSEAEVKMFMTKKMNEIAAQRAETQMVRPQDEAMDLLFGCDWQEEIPKYK
ncbi:MAG: hypothetical protein RB296_06780 [Acidobacteriota bacterium]|jgi:predicted DNA-binding transcriptional regulator AlpA|nr:hypothetical protein [Acidobacteriota bacterium]